MIPAAAPVVAEVGKALGWVILGTLGYLGWRMGSKAEDKAESVGRSFLFWSLVAFGAVYLYKHGPRGIGLGESRAAPKKEEDD